MGGAICKRGEEQGKDYREGIVEVQEQGESLAIVKRGENSEKTRNQHVEGRL